MRSHSSPLINLDDDGRNPTTNNWQFVNRNLRATLKKLSKRSSQQIAHDMSVHIRQSKIAAGVAIGKLLVIEAQRVEQRRVQIVDMHSILGSSESEFVGRSVDDTLLESSACNPHGEAV